MDHRLSLETPLGTIHFSAHAEVISGAPCEIELRVVELEPSLPPGMSVRRLRAVLLVASSPTGFERLDYRCKVMTALEGGSESGECLDAQSWEGEHDVVMIGTEDGESLSSRMPWLEFQGHPLEFVEYQNNGFNVPMRRVPGGTTISLHYVVAENGNSEPMQNSAWYALDVEHSRVLGTRTSADRT